MADSAYHEEILDLVNSSDEVVGQVTHEEAFNLENLRGNYLRASNAFVVNSKGEFWIPRRTAAKRIKPNGLDYSCAEHVISGEAYVDAMVRGFEEELNINLVPDELIFIGITEPLPGRPPYFEANYLYYSDEAPNYNVDDFVSAQWLPPTALVKLLVNGEIAKENIDRAVVLAEAYLAQHPGN